MNLLLKKLLSTAVPVLAVFVLATCDNKKESVFLQPTVVEISPLEALIGAPVTIKGERLDRVIQVKFGNIDAPDFVASENEITVAVPDGLAEGETKVTVFYSAAAENNLGPSDQTGFTVLYPPELTDIGAGVKPGFQVVITGDHLAKTSQVTVGGIETAFEATQNEITVMVPPTVTPGEVEVNVTTSGGTTSIPYTVLERTPEIHSFSPEAGAKTGEEATVKGLFFMDVQSVKLGDTEIADFDVVSDTEIKFDIPSGVSSDKVTVTTGLGSVTSEGSLTVIEIPFLVFGEALHPQMQNWSWGGTDVFNSTIVAKTGTTSYSRTYNDAWSGVQLHHGSLNLSPYSAVKFSVYGGPGTTGKILNLNINGGAAFEVELTENAWTDYTVPLSDLGSPATLDNLGFQENGNSAPAAPFTVYIDNIELVE